MWDPQSSPHRTQLIPCSECWLGCRRHGRWKREAIQIAWAKTGIGLPTPYAKLQNDNEETYVGLFDRYDGWSIQTLKRARRGTAAMCHTIKLTIETNLPTWIQS